MKKLITFTVISLLMSGCNNAPYAHIQQNDASTVLALSEQVSVQNLFKNHFKIGTSLSHDQISDSSTRELVKKHYNAVTAENAMKWEVIHPKANVYDFKVADKLTDFAQANNISVLGHTLIWHSQTPDWIFENSDGSQVSREVLLNRMEEHINTVAGRYKNRVSAWDVVNEALNEDGSYRQSQWFNIIGEDYIEQAFIMAAQAAPNAKLYYNDYNLFAPQKRQGVIKIVKNLQSKGIRIDGIGLQGHYGLDYPKLSDLQDSIQAYAELGVDVMITELDLTVLPTRNTGADISNTFQYSKELDPYPNGLPPVMAEKLAQRYEDIFSILNKHKSKISRVTFWGISDADSWKNNWPVQGRTDYPLLFDRNMKLKPFVTSLPKAE